MVARKNSLGLLFRQIIVKNIACILIAHLWNQQLIICKASVTFPWIVSSCFRQLIGIGIGSNVAPFMANVFLYYYERKWFLYTQSKVRIFSNILTFIEDLCTFNDKVFANSYNDIYPDKLKL